MPDLEAPHCQTYAKEAVLPYIKATGMQNLILLMLFCILNASPSNYGSIIPGNEF